MDVKLAFLNDILNKKVFVEQSPRYIKEGKKKQVYKLKKALHKLKQAPHALVHMN